MTTTRAKALEVSIDRTDGRQTRLTADDRIYASRFGDYVALDQVPVALADPDAWIEYDTEAVWEPAEDREPWQASEHDSEPRRARARIFARAVVECIVVYDEPA